MEFFCFSVKGNCRFTKKVDWSGRHSTPAGVRGRGDPTGAVSAEEAPRHARGKRVPGAEINTSLTEPFY